MTLPLFAMVACPHCWMACAFASSPDDVADLASDCDACGGTGQVAEDRAVAMRAEIERCRELNEKLESEIAELEAKP